MRVFPKILIETPIGSIRVSSLQFRDPCRAEPPSIAPKGSTHPGDRLESASLIEGLSELSRNKYNFMCFYYRFCNVYKCTREIALISFTLVSCRVSGQRKRNTGDFFNNWIYTVLYSLWECLCVAKMCECFGIKIALTSVCIHNKTWTQAADCAVYACLNCHRV